MASTNPGSQTNEAQADANLTYKDKLDETAHKTKYGSQDNENDGGIVNQVAEKVSQYIPAVGKVLGTEKKEDVSASQPPSGPPDRPHHDTQIEEFVRDQHRSKTEEGVLTGE